MTQKFTKRPNNLFSALAVTAIFTHTIALKRYGIKIDILIIVFKCLFSSKCQLKKALQVGSEICRYSLRCDATADNTSHPLDHHLWLWQIESSLEF